MQKFLIIIEKTGTGFSAYVPDLPGCIATGDTKELVENNIYAAIQFHLEGLKEEGLEIPETRSEAEVLLIAV
jgi:predicted RNase H-like HicB family nuclease